jgi:hypothetical protein
MNVGSLESRVASHIQRGLNAATLLYGMGMEPSIRGSVKTIVSHHCGQ